MFGWVIEKDHISEDGDPYDVTGARLGDMPEGVKGVRFALYDDDDVRYYSGRFYTDHAEGVTEEETYEVLSWAARLAGCTSMRFPGHKEWDLG